VTTHTYADGCRGIAERFDEVIVRELPISESHSSEVIHYINQNGDRRVIKQPWSIEKFHREVNYLKKLSNHPLTPELLNNAEHGGNGFILMNGLVGDPIADIQDISAKLMEQIGACLGQQHQYKEDSFEGFSCWHDLLEHQTDRYLNQMSSDDAVIGAKAKQLFRKHKRDIPNEYIPVYIHFDFRPGNLLVQNGQLTGLIDFESMRGGHASMDFYKLWQSVWQHRPELRAPLLEGYNQQASWLEPNRLESLMLIYSLNHGLGGLSWCNSRNQINSNFAQHNREVLDIAFAALEC